jgi:CO/xanthine dehydrogenase FAD-binding subunit
MRSVFLPQKLEELWPRLEDPSTFLYAGGTDLLVRLREGTLKAENLVCLERLAELKEVEDLGTAVRIGAACTHTQLLLHPLVRRHFPILIQALGGLGSPPIRHQGTIGGNIGTASPAGDTLGPLYALRAEVELRTRETARCLPIQDFIQGPGRTDLKSGEIITEVRVPKCPAFNLHHYEKVGQRRALAIAIAGLAVLMRISGDQTIEAVRLAWGSVGPTVVTSAPVEAFLRGRSLSREVLREAADLARQAVAPIDDLRASADYRREVAGNLLRRLILYSPSLLRREDSLSLSPHSSPGERAG